MNFPIDQVRAAFPALAVPGKSGNRVYLDNPAGTQVSQSVVDAVAKCLVESNANLDGQFETSRRAHGVVDEAHAAMADFLGAAGPDEIVIGPNMTTLTFQMSRSICRDFRPGDEIVVTRMDHEADIAPWLEIAADKDLTIRWVPFDEDSWQIEPDALSAALSDRTRLVALNYASNLTGSINDLRGLTSVAKEAGALVYVDAVQYAPHGLIDVGAIGCDFLVCSSYKFFGPHLGIFWGRRELLQEMHAYKCRNVPDALPEKFETGTYQFELLAGLTATVDYFAWLGRQSGCAKAGAAGRRELVARAFAAAQEHEMQLTAMLISGIREIPGLTIRGITNPNRMSQRVPTVSFTHDSQTPVEIAKALAAQDIFVWNGHNYAVEIVRQLGIPEDKGVVRIGIAHYNTEAEIERTLTALRELLA